jgi:hypothetical protein
MDLGEGVRAIVEEGRRRSMNDDMSSAYRQLEDVGKGIVIIKELLLERYSNEAESVLRNVKHQVEIALGYLDKGSRT